MATPPQQQQKLVNKQFNSPIGLYSEQNIKEVLDRETRLLGNGAIGINFQSPSNVAMTKPANLHNSAVLRMLEEEESRQRNGQMPGVKRVAWPPPKDESEEAECDFVEQEAVQAQGGAQFTTSKPSLQRYSNNQQATTETQSNIYAPQSPVVQNNQAPQAAWKPGFAPQAQAEPWRQPSSQSQAAPWRQPSPQSPVVQANQPQSPVVQAHSPVIQPVQSPVIQPVQSPVAWKQPAQTNQPAWRPISSPQPQPQPQQQQKSETFVWKPSVAPQTKPTSSQPPKPEERIIPIQIESVVNSKFENPAGRPQGQQQPQQQYRPAPVKAPVEPPPSLITLRPTVPISQAPAPVYASQPATATLRGGKNLRGDMKWPPENVKEKMETETKMKEELAKGPACRPKKVAKDYSGFFAQHALNSTYPGYKVPPGTQYYEHHPVM